MRTTTSNLYLYLVEVNNHSLSTLRKYSHSTYNTAIFEIKL